MQNETRIKACKLCGQDCSHRSRVRDAQGNYYCDDCYDGARKQRRSERARSDAHSETIARAIAETPATQQCLRCGDHLMPSAVLCTGCGLDQRTGQSYESTVEASAGGATPVIPAVGKWDLLLARQGAEAQRAARREYFIPAALLGLGVGGVLSLLLIVNGDAVASAMVGGYLLGLGIEVAVGVVGLCIAARLWLGGAGPLPLAVLRLAGIYAIVDAITIVVSPLFLVGWVIRIGVYVGLLSSLFDLDARDSAMLVIVTFTLKLAVGFGIAAFAMA